MTPYEPITRRSSFLLKLVHCAAMTALLMCLASACLAASELVNAETALDRGFRLLYDLRFEEARLQFDSWERLHPDDAMGPVAQAAGMSFSEFDRLGVLEAQFFENDKAFQDRPKVLPDAQIRDRFNQTLVRAENLARVRLTKNSKDRDALLAMTLVWGLRANYAALVEKRNVASLKYTRQSESWGSQLLAVDPGCYDAYLARGISRYIVGSLPAPFRWVLRLGGLDGDKIAGLTDLRKAADRGHYLAPFARILLAIASVRDKDKAGAVRLLASLREEFPANPLFDREIRRLERAQ